MKMKNIFEKMGKFFATKGRINRAKFLIYSIFMVLLLNLITELYKGLLIQKFLVLLVFVISIVKYISITVKRFHDIEMPGNNIILLIVPIINIYFYFLLLIKKGTDGKNLYGDDPLIKLQ